MSLSASLQLFHNKKNHSPLSLSNGFTTRYIFEMGLVLVEKAQTDRPGDEVSLFLSKQALHEQQRHKLARHFPSKCLYFLPVEKKPTSQGKTRRLKPLQTPRNPKTPGHPPMGFSSRHAELLCLLPSDPTLFLSTHLVFKGKIKPL